MIFIGDLKLGIGDCRFRRRELQAILQKRMRTAEKGVHRKNESLRCPVGFCKIENAVRSIFGTLANCSISCLEVGVHIGSAKPIDRLLGIANEDQITIWRTEKNFLKNFKLAGVGILRFVNQSNLVSRADFLRQSNPVLRVVESLVKGINQTVVGDLAVGRQSSIEGVFDYGRRLIQP